LEKAALTGKPYLSEPFAIVQGKQGYSLMIPYRNQTFFEIVFESKKIFGSTSQFRHGESIEIKINDKSVPVFESGNYNERHSKYDNHETVAEGKILNRTFHLSAVPTEQFHNKFSGFSQVLLTSSLIFMLILMSAAIAIITISSRYRKRSEEKLKEERNRAQQYLDISGTMFVAIDKTQRVTLINQKGCEILGYEEDEIIGQNWFDTFIPERLRDDIKKVFNALMAGKIASVMHYENPVLCKNRKEKIIAWHNTVLTDEQAGIVGTLASGEDITERIKIEKIILTTEEHERRRIGYDLHDGLGQLLAGVAYKAEALEMQLKESRPREAENVNRIISLIMEAKGQIKLLTHGINLSTNDEEGLISSLADLASNTKRVFNISCSFDCDSTFQVHDRSSIVHLYRIAQEAVTNAVRHGKPNHIIIQLTQNNNSIALTVEDDGRGIRSSVTSEGMGIKIMHYRAGLINAQLNISNRNGGGTLVSCVFTCASAEIVKTP
jgi:two-component system CheB/CheR fusion protein